MLLCCSLSMSKCDAWATEKRSIVWLRARVCVCVCASVSASVREIVCARWRRWEKERVRANTANSKAGVTERKQIGGERAGAKLYCRQVHHHHQHRHQQQNLRPKWDGNKEWHSMCTVLLHAMLWLQLCECGRVSWHTRFFFSLPQSTIYQYRFIYIFSLECAHTHTQSQPFGSLHCIIMFDRRSNTPLHSNR